jgi:pSer/pThr/pTyr-binding forkhead associated (FHA) protein
VASNGQTYALQLPTLTIGREGDVLLPDHMASRQHARLEQTPAGWQITDLGSSNGTFVNVQRLTPHQPRSLQPGDQIMVGGTTLTFDPLSGGTPAPVRSGAPTQHNPSLGSLQPPLPSAGAVAHLAQPAAG